VGPQLRGRRLLRPVASAHMQHRLRQSTLSLGDFLKSTISKSPMVLDCLLSSFCCVVDFSPYLFQHVCGDDELAGRATS